MARGEVPSRPVTDSAGPPDAADGAPDASDVPAAAPVPGLTACSLCAGETFGEPEVQRARLEALAAGGVARLTFVECLDECERGDVVVARPTPACRARGAAPVWFERLAGERPTARLADWLRAGGPGAAPVPGELAPLVLRASTDPGE